MEEGIYLLQQPPHKASGNLSGRGAKGKSRHRSLSG